MATASDPWLSEIELAQLDRARRILRGLRDRALDTATDSGSETLVAGCAGDAADDIGQLISVCDRWPASPPVEPQSLRA